MLLTSGSAGGSIGAGYEIIAGVQYPIYGTTSTGSTPSGYTVYKNSSFDDNNFGYSHSAIPFTINNTNFTTTYIGSNNYVTWGSGQNSYSGYNFSSWNVPKVLLTATSDNSYQYVTAKTFGSDYFRVGVEGNASTSGTVGAGNIVWEMTVFNASVTPNGYGMIEFRCGSNGRGTGYTMGIGSTSFAYTTHSSLVNNSVVYRANNSGGTSWTAFVGWHVSGYTG